jgi:hypothetical protein
VWSCSHTAALAASSINSFSAINEAEMLYRPPEPEPSGRLRDVALVFGLVALGIVTTAGAVWAVFQVGGVIP